MKRLRWTLALIALLLAAQLAFVVGAVRDRRSDTGGGFALPLPDQAAAIASLLERAEDEALALRAVNGPQVRVRVLDRAPAPPPQARRLPAIERAVTSYIAAVEGAAGGREVDVYLAVPPGAEADTRVELRGLALWSDAPLRIEVGLTDGRKVRIETRGDLAARVLGWPVGLAAGVLGLLTAALALWTLWREARPLAQLARSIEAFGEGEHDAVADLPRPAGSAEARTVIAAFGRARGRVGALLEERRLMLAGLSHDLRTYLTRLRLRVEALEDGPRERAVRDLDAMARMLADASTFARLGDAPPRLEPLALAPLIAEAAEPYGVDAPATAPRAVADPALLARCLANLFENATRHAGGFEIVARATRGAAVIEVLDRGPGIPAARRAALAAPFARGDEARTLDVPGSGLGLAIVAALMARMGGRLELGDREGGGLAARLVLRGA